MEELKDNRSPYRSWRWLIVGGIVFLFGRTVLLGGEDDQNKNEVRSNEVIERSVAAQWVTVKYRADPVNVASGNFQHWMPLASEAGNVRQAWYSANYNYMLIQLGGTVYHYCEFGLYDWEALINADNVDSHYARLIRGGVKNDCRRASVPESP